MPTLALINRLIPLHAETTAILCEDCVLHEVPGLLRPDPEPEPSALNLA